MTRVIVTGAAGFIGHHVVEHFYKYTDWYIIVIDKLNYASKGYERLRNAGVLDHKRVVVYTYDLCNPISPGLMYELGKIDYIFHLAAETHVDNSIKYPREFIRNNVESTVNILEYARECPNLKKFFYFSTDEVFGPALGDMLYKENDRHRPTNPYSASKSAGEQIAISYENTYKVPVVIVNCMNAFGERQHIEKFIPMTIKKVLNGEKVLIHADKDCKNAGTRFYIHGRNIAAALLFLLEPGVVGEKYNIMGEREVSNLEMAQFIADVIGKPLDYEMIDFHSDRPGHDLRYGLNGDKMAELGWELPVDFDHSLRKTIEWTVKNQDWLE